MLKKKVLQCYNSYLSTKRGSIDDISESECYSAFPCNVELTKLRIEGLITTIPFQRARLCAQNLYQHLPHRFAKPKIKEMFQVEWYKYLETMKRTVGGKMWVLNRCVAVFINDVFIGSDIEFLQRISESYVVYIPRDAGYYEMVIAEYYKEFIEKTKRKYVYFNFSVNGIPLGSLLFMLYSDLLPNTCQYFLDLCTGKYKHSKGGKPYYLNKYVHRIVKNGWVQMGEVNLKEDCSKPAVINKIPDESYCIPHDGIGVLSMANDGKHSNGPQFFVCLKSNNWMDYFYVAFGQLVEGLQTLKKLESMQTYYEVPKKKIVISGCGEYSFEKDRRPGSDTNIFLEHHVPKIYMGEDVCDQSQPIYSDIPMWLDNIIDEIDVRDTASLLMAERYLSDLYCLSTDCLPEIDKRCSKLDRASIQDNDVCNTYKTTMYELLRNYHPQTMSKEEKIQFIKRLYMNMLNFVNKNKCCSQYTSKHTCEIVCKTLEYAYDIARAIIAKNLKDSSSVLHSDGDINKLLRIEGQRDDMTLNSALLLIEEILQKSINYTINFENCNE